MRLTKGMVEVFYNQNRIASHCRLYSHPGQYSAVEAHMPKDHQKYLLLDGDRFIRWAESISPATAIAVKGILTSHKIQQQGCKSCMGFLKLADKYSVIKLENAYVRALSFTPHPSYKSIKNILVTGQDKLEIAPEEKKPVNNEYGLTRDAKYYGREKLC